MSILKSGGLPPFSPSPGHVIGGGSWRVLEGHFDGSPGGGPATFDLPLWGGGPLGLLSCWLPPTQGNIVFASFWPIFLLLYSPLDTALLFGGNAAIG
jgi:hypothetical protein